MPPSFPRKSDSWSEPDRIQWSPLKFVVRKSVADHIQERMAERSLTPADLIPMFQWVDMKPVVPDCDWYKEFPKFTLVGKGETPRSMLKPRMKAWGMKLAADAADVNAITREYFNQFMPKGIEFPVIKIVNQLKSAWLGRCRWDPAKTWTNTTIEIQKSILGDEKSLRRVIAHELCHHEDLVNNWARLSPQQRHWIDKLKTEEVGGHGKSWQAIADRMNAVLGADFVTKTSDASYVLSETDKKYLLMIQQDSLGRLTYAITLNTSEKQVGYLSYVNAKDKEKGVPPSIKLFRVSTPLFLSGASIGTARSIPDTKEEVDLLRQLWDSGEQVPIPDPPKKNPLNFQKLAQKIYEEMKASHSNFTPNGLRGLLTWDFELKRQRGSRTLVLLQRKGLSDTQWRELAKYIETTFDLHHPDTTPKKPSEDMQKILDDPSNDALLKELDGTGKAASESGAEAPKWLHDHYKKNRIDPSLVEEGWSAIQTNRQEIAASTLAYAREQGYEVTPDDNLVLYHGTRSGNQIRKAGFLHAGSFLTAIKADAEGYARAAQSRGKAEVLRLEVFPGYGTFSGNGYFVSREPIPVRGARIASVGTTAQDFVQAAIEELRRAGWSDSEITAALASDRSMKYRVLPLSPAFMHAWKMRREGKRGEAQFRQFVVDMVRVLATPKTAAAAITETPQFKAWFRDSKVVDDKGRPLPVYHGTKADFDTFRLDMAGTNNDPGMWGTGFYFSPQRRMSLGYGPTMKRVYLSLQNPLIIGDRIPLPEGLDRPGGVDLTKDVADTFRERLISLGYDGVMQYSNGWKYPAQIVALYPNQIKSVKGNSGDFDRDSHSILASTATAITETPQFKAWFSGSKIIGVDRKPMPLFHGTTYDFDTFNPAGGYGQGYYGPAIYLTNSKTDVNANYGGIGPDLQAKINLETEKRMYELVEEKISEGELEEEPAYGSEGYENLEEQARQEVTKKLVGPHQGVVMPCYLKMTNPVFVQPKGGTRFNIDFDEDTGDETGTGVKLWEAFMLELAHSEVDPQKLWSDSMGKLDEYSDFTAFEFEQAVRSSNESVELEDGPGKWIAAVYREMGFDGIIQDASGQFQNMKMDKGTKHFIAFEPNQVKSAIGNSGAFDPTDHRITAGSKLLQKNAFPDFGYSRYNPKKEKALAKVEIVPLEDSDGSLLVEAHLGDNLLGQLTAITVESDLTTFMMTNVWIDPKWRGTGLGQMLYDGGIQEAKRRGGEVFESDERMTPQAQSAWDRLSARYPVTTRPGAARLLDEKAEDMYMYGDGFAIDLTKVSDSVRT